MPARFRCCRNYTTAGHTPDCPLKPSAVDVEDKGETDEETQGCKFDILHFKHIGKCQGTCGDADEGVQFEGIGEDGEKQILVIMMVDLGDDPEAKLKELEERGLRRLSKEEIDQIIEMEERGELKIQIQVTTLADIEARFPKPDEQPKEDPDPFMSIKEAAATLGFSQGWTRTLCRKGRLPGAMKLIHQWAIPRSAIFEED